MEGTIEIQVFYSKSQVGEIAPRITKTSSRQEVAKFFNEWHEGEFKHCFKGFNGKELSMLSEQQFYKTIGTLGYLIYNQLHELEIPATGTDKF